MSETFSPEIMAWLLGLGPSPFDIPPEHNSQVIDNWGPPKNESEIGTMPHQNARLTAQGKANNQFSDYAFLSQMGDMGPEMYQPQAVPVDAPGYGMAQQYGASGDPVSQFIAQVLQSGGTSNAAEMMLNQIYNDPEHPNHAEIVPWVPTFQSDQFGTIQEQPDWRRVRDIATSLEETLLSDPGFQGVDEFGRPVNYELGEFAQWEADRGIPSPYEQYSPDTLADPHVIDKEQDNLFRLPERERSLQEAEAEWQAARDERSSLDGRSVASFLIGDEEERFAEGGASFDRPTDTRRSTRHGAHTRSSYNAPPEDRGQYEPRDTPQSRRRGARQGEGSGPTPTDTAGGGRRTASHLGLQRRGGATRQSDQRVGQGLEARDKAFVSERDLREATDRNKIAQIDRQRMMNMLSSQGHTPRNDVLRARQGNIYGY